jgi:AraC-like DNA-binding protein
MLTSRQLQSLTITLLNTELARCDKSWNYSGVNSPFSRLYLVLEGSGEVVHSGRKFVLEPETVLLVPAFTDSSYRCDDYLLQYYVHFTHSNPAGGLFDQEGIEYLQKAHKTDYYFFKRLLDLNPGKELIERDPARYHKNFQIKQSFEMADRMDPASYLESVGIIQQLIARFIGPQISRDRKQLMSRYNLSSILDFINSNLEKKITVEHLAAKMFVSKDHFSRIFLEMMGLRPLEYITRKRIERSQMLLLSTNDGLEQIALKCGFSSTSHLSRHFKKHLSISPGGYRKLHS